MNTSGDALYHTEEEHSEERMRKQDIMIGKVRVKITLLADSISQKDHQKQKYLHIIR